MTLLRDLIWPLLMTELQMWGLPVLALPFNVTLILTVLLFSTVSWLKDYRVPPGIALTDPETVRLWWQKRQNAQGCWR